MSYSGERLNTDRAGDDDNGDATNIQENPYDMKGDKQKIECCLQDNLPKESIDEAKDQGNKEGELNNFYCKLCDLKFASEAHVKQHCDGRSHKLPHFRKFGGEMFDKYGKWERFGPNSDGPIIDVLTRFGIGGFGKSDKKPLPTPTLPKPKPRPPSLASCVESYENKFGEVVTLDFEEGLKMVEEESRLEKLYNDQQAEAQSHKLYCELCDIKLSSVIDAKRHYAGRKHNAVRNKNKK